MGSSEKTLRLYGTATDSIVDGPGLRYTVFVQGCSHACSGCHNPESQPYEGGTVKKVDDLVGEILANKLIQGVTLSGGEPLDQSAGILDLARKLSENDIPLWLYTGYLIEDVAKGRPDERAREVVSLCEVVVDGPFVETMHSYDLSWRGSSNQRLVDVQASKKAGKIVLWEKDQSYPQAPSSW